MTLDREQSAWLHKALEALASGASRGFEDALWLGFGNAWAPLRDRLLHAGYVRVSPREGQWSLTDRGGELRQTLSAFSRSA